MQEQPKENRALSKEEMDSLPTGGKLVHPLPNRKYFRKKSKSSTKKSGGKNPIIDRLATTLFRNSTMEERDAMLKLDKHIVCGTPEEPTLVKAKKVGNKMIILKH